MAAARKQNHSRWHHLYKHIDTDNICVYCGLPADTYDHVPPLSRVDDYRALVTHQETYILVSCCRQCNSLLSNSLQENIICRYDVLKIRLRSRLNKHIMKREWTQEEIAQLGPNLKTKIMRAVNLHNRAQERLQYSPNFLELLKYV